MEGWTVWQILMVGFIAGFGMGFVVALILWIMLLPDTNYLPSREELELIKCMNRCSAEGLKFGSAEFDSCVQRCQDQLRLQPDRRKTK